METFKMKITEIFAVIFMTIMIYLEDIIELLFTAITTIVICLLLTEYLIMPIRVNGTSMYPTLDNKSIGFSNIIGRKINGLKRFDIVIVYLEEKDEKIVKRIIGMPNETISYIDGILYVDENPVEEYFLDKNYIKQQLSLSYHDYFTEDFTYQLGDDEYFCLGDNRLVSADSRIYGPFLSDEILSKDIFIIFPFSKFGFAE